MIPSRAHALILRPGALGDTLLLAPALAGLEARAETTVLGRQPGLFFLEPLATRCEDFEAKEWHRLFVKDPEGLPSWAFSEPGFVIGFLNDAKGRIRENLKALFPRTEVSIHAGAPSGKHPVHVALHLARCLAQAGLPVDPEACLQRAQGLPLLASDRDWPAEGDVVLHPGSGGQGKNYSLDFWRDLARSLRKVEGRIASAPITVLLGPAEEDRSGGFEAWAGQGGVRMQVSPDPPALRSLLARAAVFVGHDSGVTHLAALLGTPTVALFRKTDSRVWGPLGPRVRVVSEETEHGVLLKRTLGAVQELLGG